MSDSSPLLVRFPVELKRRVRVDAARHDRSMNAHICALLDENTPELEDEREPIAS